MDVIVVGAGPAGSMAAQAVAEKGYSVTVLEKGPLRREKPCGGAVSDRVEKEFGLNPEDKFWDRQCKGVTLCSPHNRTASLTSDETLAYLVMRETFDYYLVEKAQKKGVKFVDNTFVEPFLKNGKVRGVKTKEEIIESDIVIACDGTPSTFARKLGIYRGNDRNQAATYQYQMKMDNKEIEEKIGNNIEIYFGHHWVPYGYTWIFPKDGKVTVGNGTWFRAFKKFKINMKECLNTFINKHPVASLKLENAEILYPQSAMIGFTGISNPMYLDNIMIAGDAAGFVSLPTGEGIYYSMVSGRIAGEVAGKALNKKDTTRRVLKEYEKRTSKEIGADMKWGPWIRRLALNKESDQENLVKLSIEDTWFGNMARDLIFGDIKYDKFLISFLKRPHKLLTFKLSY
ncbi:MAG: geranylgeranyl reductase family protein [Theionarchaea archaeon]|nr:geranylgeranyl reductase family protein [Theionarchaea archaeon]